MSARPELRRVAARTALGERPAHAVARARTLFGEHAGYLGALISMSERLGADPSRLLGGLADQIEKEAIERDHARSMVAGSVLSGRLVGALPLLALPILPSAVGRAGALGIAAVILGLALCVVGGLWLKRLMPPLPHGDEVALMAESVAVACDAGIDPDRALDTLATTRIPGLADELARLRRISHLGIGWSGALVWSSDERIAALGRSLRNAQRHGTSCAEVLRDHSRRLRSARGLRLETETRRAPVKMVLPLTLCLLPGFALLLAVPFAATMSG